MALLVKDIMSTHLVTIREDDPITVLMEVFNHAHVSGLPVVNPQGSVVGVVSKTDLTDHLVLQHVRQQLSLEGLQVKDLLLHHSPVVVHESDRVADASRLMKRVRVHRVLVKNDAAQIVGILTTFDILKTFSPGCHGHQGYDEGHHHHSHIKNDANAHEHNELASDELACYEASRSAADTNKAKHEAHAKPNLGEIRMPKPPHPLKVLSARELQVLALIAEGKTNAQIQKVLQLSDDWLHGYIQNIVVKLEVENEIQAVRRAVDEKIIEHAPVLESDMAV